jgi:hypothetical protein
MGLDKLCSIEFRYLDAHFPKPYGDESGPGWGIGEGTVSGERLSGTIKWSNHPSPRGDGVALPDFRGVISTADGAKVMVSFTGRTAGALAGSTQAAASMNDVAARCSTAWPCDCQLERGGKTAAALTGPSRLSGQLSGRAAVDDSGWGSRASRT